MSIQISEFTGMATNARGDATEILDGPPLRVSAPGILGPYTVGDRCTVVRIAGSGAITWPGSTAAEAFTGVEVRRLRPGDVFVIG